VAIFHNFVSGGLSFSRAICLCRDQEKCSNRSKYGEDYTEDRGGDLTRVDERVEPLNVEERTFRMRVVQRVWYGRCRDIHLHGSWRESKRPSR
jgi:hypothetical protein